MFKHWTEFWEVRELLSKLDQAYTLVLDILQPEGERVNQKGTIQIVSSPINKKILRVMRA